MALKGHAREASLAMKVMAEAIKKRWSTISRLRSNEPLQYE